MPTWHKIMNEVNEAGSIADVVRRSYIRELSRLTGRNTILYYSGWLQKGHLPDTKHKMSIDDQDKNGFMSVVHDLDRSRGLDLLLHSPGGDMAATESLIAYLRAVFGPEMRAIVPQIAMSGGTLMACACKVIFMGEQSNLGPFDPQVYGVPAQAIVEEFSRANREIHEDERRAQLWQPILQKYSPGLISQCEKVIAMADEVATSCLATGMFDGLPDAQERAAKVVSELGSHALTKLHSRHLHRNTARAIGLEIVDLEADASLNEAVLSVHHAAMLSFDRTDAVKLIENQFATTYVVR